jgi:c-di-AMP phosphodiesterase-like protein
MGPVTLFRSTNRPYGILAVEDDGEVIWAETVTDEAKIAGNMVPKEEFNKKLIQEEWENDLNTKFTFADGEFQLINQKNTL